MSTIQPVESLNKLLHSFNTLTSTETTEAFKKELINPTLQSKVSELQKIIKNPNELTNLSITNKLEALTSLYSLNESFIDVQNRYKLLNDNEGIVSKIKYLISWIFSSAVRYQAKEASKKIRELETLQISLNKEKWQLNNAAKKDLTKLATEFNSTKQRFTKKILTQQTTLINPAFLEIYQSLDFKQFIENFKNEYTKQTNDENKIDCLLEYFITKIRDRSFFSSIETHLKKEEGQNYLMIIFLLSSPIGFDLTIFSASKNKMRQKIASLLKQMIHLIKQNA